MRAGYVEESAGTPHAAPDARRETPARPVSHLQLGRRPGCVALPAPASNTRAATLHF